jgi:hypothetical protein
MITIRVYCPMLWDGKCWQEAYGYLGSYYHSYIAARWEIDFIMREFPDKYQAWQIERFELDENKFRVNGENDVVIAMSKDVS